MTYKGKKLLNIFENKKNKLIIKKIMSITGNSPNNRLVEA